MTREQAKQNLVGFGISEPTEEQITNYLNQIGAETKKEKERADGLKAKAEKSDQLQAELDRINEQNLSDIDKANKNLEKANNRIAELEKAQAIATQKGLVVEKFKVTAEQADKIVKEDGSIDYDVLGQIISDKETAAANAKEQEIAKKSTNPGGGSGGGSEGETSAEKIAKKLFSKEKQESDVLSHYLGGN